MKRTKDLRGHQSNVHRLSKFDSEGLIHMVAYRWLIIFSVIYGILLLLSLYYYPQLAYAVKIATVVIWMLFTPTAYETVKGLSLISSRGLAFGHLSKEYTEIMNSKYHRSSGIFKYVPQFAMLLWLIGFIVMVLFWQI